MAGSQALNAEDAVTVAEPRWPPPIQNATAAVVTDGDYANVQRTVGFHLKRPRRLRRKAATRSEETPGGWQKATAEKTQQDSTDSVTVDYSKNTSLVPPFIGNQLQQDHRGLRQRNETISDY